MYKGVWLDARPELVKHLEILDALLSKLLVFSVMYFIALFKCPTHSWTLRRLCVDILAYALESYPVCHQNFLVAMAKPTLVPTRHSPFTFFLHFLLSKGTPAAIGDPFLEKSRSFFKGDEF